MDTVQWDKLEGYGINVGGGGREAAGPPAALLLDVREPGELKTTPLPLSSTGSGASFLNIPLPQLRGRLAELGEDKARPIVVTCAVGLRGYIASRLLHGHGFTNVHNLDGGAKTLITALKQVA